MEKRGELVISELSTVSLRRLVDICDRFESQWCANVRSIFEEFLEAIPWEERRPALRELLNIDIELRRQVGQEPELRDYDGVSSIYFDLVREALDDSCGKAIFPSIAGHEILERLGFGGMGMVYRARQVATGRMVAVKMVRIDLAEWISQAEREELAKRFEDEARAIAMLDHAGIVPLFEVGEADGWCYFTMRYMEGGSLAELAKNGIEWKRAARLVADVAKAIQYAHDKGILHRDIKPANILLDKEDRPRIGDFGLAKLASDTAVYSRSMPGIGTPGYMPPEQTLGGELTARSDVFGLGATLFELLTGSHPTNIGATSELSKKLLSAPPPLRAICLQCLRENPVERYASAGDVADDLNRALVGGAVRALPDGWRGRVRRAVNKPLVKFGTIALCTILLASFGYWFGYARPKIIKRALRSRLELVLQKLSVAKNAVPLFELEALCREIPSAMPDLHEAAEANLASWASLVPEVEFMADAPQRISASAANPSGNRFAIGTETGEIVVFDRVANSTRKLEKAHDARIMAIAWSPDGESFASSGEDNRVQIWTAMENSVRTSSKLQINDSVSALAFADQGEKLFVGSVSGQYKGLSLWNCQDGSLVRKLDSEGVEDLYSSPVGNRVVVLMANDARHLWDATRFEKIAALPEGIGRGCFARNGSILVTSGKNLCCFSSDTGAPFTDGMLQEIDARSVVFVGPVGDSGVFWHDSAGASHLTYNAPRSLERLLMPREFNHRFASCGSNYVWFTDHESVVALRMCAPIQRFATPEDIHIRSIDRLDDGRAIGLTFRSKLDSDNPWGVAIWDTAELSKLPKFLTLPTKTYLVSAVACNESSIAFSTESERAKQIHLLDSQTFCERLLIETQFGVTALAILPGGEIAAAGDDRCIRLYDPKGEVISKSESGLRATRLAVRCDGKWIAAIDISNKMIGLQVTPALSLAWSATVPGQITGLAFTEDGDSIMALSPTGAARPVRTLDGTTLETVADWYGTEKVGVVHTAALNTELQRALMIDKDGPQIWATAVNLPIGSSMKVDAVRATAILAQNQIALLSKTDILLSRQTTLPRSADRGQWLSSMSATNRAAPMTVEEWRKRTESPNNKSTKERMSKSGKKH